MNWSMRNVSDMIVAVYLIVNGCEWFYLSMKQELIPVIGKSAILLRIQDRGLPKLLTRISSTMATKIGVRLGAAAMVCSGLLLFAIAANAKISPTISIMAFMVAVTFNATIAIGLEGADQMAVLVLFVNAVTSFLPQLQALTNFFILVQLILSYVVAGIAKLVSADWRSGRALAMIVSTRSFGLGSSSLFIRHTSIAKVICVSIIIYELSWFAAPFNKELLLALMGLGVIFHFANTWILGLNLFPWAFLSAYPLALSAYYQLHS